MASDPKKPYGDVTYADPGYQADGVKRYPIDTEAHCRAAWSYINQSKNASKYSSSELAKVKGRIRAALKRYGADVEDSSESAMTGATVSFDLPEVDAAFRVNVERRTITGLAVPWGQVARSGNVKYRFAPGSLEFSDPRRVKLILEHDRFHGLGRATELDNRDDGLYAKLSVARGADGDKALSLAEDGFLDGLSVGIEFIEDHYPAPDPSDRSIQFVQRATLREISLTAFPSFDSARITDVAASRTKERETMPPSATEIEAEVGSFDLDAHFSQLAEQTSAAHLELTTKLSESIGNSVAAGIKTALESLPAPQDGPQPVRAARYAVTSEPPVYSLNQAHPGPSLVRDAYYAATTQDQDAKERLRKYRQQSEHIAELAGVKLAARTLDAQFTTATTVTDPEIIPPGYRPDLYVPQLDQQRPLVGSLSHGTISNATPFVVPVFTSITGGSAVHVEGTNPTDGTLAFASKTVSPLGISGLLKLTREIVDSSNPAIDAIALGAMREAYSQQTETAVYTLLNGTSGAGGVITGDFVPSGAQAVTVAGGTDQQTLVKMLRERLAKYPFNRFASPTAAHMGSAATVRLSTAVDTTQRSLFPSVGAMNSTGTGSTANQAWNVDGLGFIPTWAMTGVAAGDSQILIINRPDAWVWESALLSFRYEERSGPALIELAMFGYFGTHLLRPVGLSGIRIT